MLVPVALEFYRDAAHKIVDKTFENPEPALKLVEALDAVSKHYGPTLRAEFEAFSAKLEERGASSVVTKRVEALNKGYKIEWKEAYGGQLYKMNATLTSVGSGIALSPDLLRS